MKKHIPNFITLLNLFSGLVAIIFVMKNQLEWAGFFVALGIFFDFFDGLFARMLNVKSELGLQLDSLADMVTSGVVPGLVMMQLLQNVFASCPNFFMREVFPFAGFLISLGSALRLAKFNIDTRQTNGFIGLPTPANALLILSVGLIIKDETSAVASFLNNGIVLIGLTLFSAFILNAEIKLFALKFTNFSFKNNKLIYVFLLICLFLLIFLKIMAIPAIILLYILISVIKNRNLNTK